MLDARPDRESTPPADEPPPRRVLLVEDDRELGDDLTKRLERAGYAPTWLRDG